MTTTRWRFLFGEGWGIHDDDMVALLFLLCVCFRGWGWVGGWEFMTTTRWRFLFGEGWGIHDDDMIALLFLLCVCFQGGGGIHDYDKVAVL